MNKPITSIVVVGGGTAGWITAGRLAASLKKRFGHSTSTPHPIRVSLVESAKKPPIAVGEGTWPTMRNTLKQLEISETDFIRHCDVAFKQGAKFSGWVTGEKDDYYYHPLVLPQDFSQVDIAPLWQWQKSHQADTPSFSNSVCFQEALCENNLAPKNIRTPEFAGVANYAYHLDSEKFSQYLQKHCQEKLGVEHIIGDVEEIHEQQDGDISALSIRLHPHNEALRLSGDLFIDCTGFSSLLLGQHYQVPTISCQEILFADTALATRVPYLDEKAPIATHTIATAQNAGWVWDIGLQSRRGVGYVYSSRFSSEDEALATLLRYTQQGDTQSPIKEEDIRKIPINAGYRRLFWHKNCVAVGLSAGFLEPLEASALVLVELSANMLAEQLPANRAMMDIVAKRFNDTFRYRWERIIEFLKLHYVLTRRSEPFWQANTAAESIPESLKELLELWRYHSPRDFDFSSNNEVFPAASWQYVLFGMQFEPNYEHLHLPDSPFAAMAHAAQEKNQAMINRCMPQLPQHRQLLEKICEFGLQPI